LPSATRAALASTIAKAHLEPVLYSILFTFPDIDKDNRKLIPSSWARESVRQSIRIGGVPVDQDFRKDGMPDFTIPMGNSPAVGKTLEQVSLESRMKKKAQQGKSSIFDGTLSPDLPGRRIRLKKRSSVQ
jgi:hypothetical protein